MPRRVPHDQRALRQSQRIPEEEAEAQAKDEAEASSTAGRGSSFS